MNPLIWYAHPVENRTHTIPIFFVVLTKLETSLETMLFQDAVS